MTLDSLTRTLADLTPALKNHLWQSTLFLLVAAILTLVLRHNHARTRYWLWLAASIKFLIPFSLLITLGSHLATPRPTPSTQTAVYFAMEEVSQPFTPITIPTIITPTTPTEHPTHLLPISLAALWLTGFLTVLTIWFIYWRKISTILRASTPITAGRELQILRRLERAATLRNNIQLLASPTTLGPGIYGLLRPILIWPAAISHRLTETHIEAIFAHEICHVRRRDNLTAALHMLVEAVFWFHPLVWWLGARLEAERERACDESVLSLTTQPHIYAESILKICEFYVESPLPCVSGVTGADLKQRLTDILERHATLKLTLAKKLLLTAAALLAITIPILSGQARAMQRLSSLIDTAPRRFIPSDLIAPVEANPNAPDSETSDATNDPAFEVATIRPAQSGAPVGFHLTPSGRFTATEPLFNLVVLAYGEKHSATVVAGPKWQDSPQLYEVSAKVDDANMVGWEKLSDAERYDRVWPMLRTLLAERFHLKLNVETRSTPVYALVQAKGGAKIKEVSAEDLQARQSPDQDAPPHKPAPGASARSGNTWKGNAVPIANLVGLVAGISGSDRLVVDQTGLKGSYDFTFEVPNGNDGATAPELIERGLGLKLEPQKVPMKTYVIESAEQPSLDGAESPEQPPATLKSVAFVQQKPTPAPQAAPPWLPGAVTTIPLGANGKPLTFDIVSFRRTHTPGSSRIDAPETGDFIAYHGQPISRVIYFAYLAIGPKIIGGPDWLDKDLYDFQAKVAAEDVEIWQKTDLDAKRLMVRALLTEVLKLKVHANETPENVFELVVAKGGPKLKEYVEGETKKFPDGFVVTGTNSHWASPAELYSQGATLNHLADVLTTYHTTDREVVDRTGLTGKYDYTLPAMPLTPEQADQFNAPSLSSALQQYGLKLQPGKATYPAIVIDHVERPPDN